MEKKAADFKAVQAGLQEPDKALRRRAWLELPERHNQQRFTKSEFDVLSHMIPRETDMDCRTVGILSLLTILHSPGGRLVQNEKLSEWLFAPFLPARGHSLVLSVSEKRDFRDVQALIEIARTLPTHRYARTRFHHVQSESADWSGTDLDHAHGICFIGRPGMFEGCGIMGQFPKLRFSIERAGGSRFFGVTQARAHEGSIAYPIKDVDTGGGVRRRYDHAIVQRFVVRHNSREAVVVVIAGGSSLGTLGAARWITETKWTEEQQADYIRIAAVEKLDTATATFEALLEVSAIVHDPPRPWMVENIIEKKLFLNKSRNLNAEGMSISLATESEHPVRADEVRYVLFDDDEMDFSEKDRAALIAFCLKYIQAPLERVALKDLTEDPRLWPNGVCSIEKDRPAKHFFRDHLQKRSLSGCIEVTDDSITLTRGTIKRIPAREAAASSEG